MVNIQEWYNKKNKKIEFEYGKFQEKLVIVIDEKYSEVEKINLYGIESIEKIILKDLPQLSKCTIQECGLKDLVIENCPQLKVLNVKNNSLTGLDFLVNLDNLEELEIDGNPELIEILKSYGSDWKVYKENKDIQEIFKFTRQKDIQELAKKCLGLSKRHEYLKSALVSFSENGQEANTKELVKNFKVKETKLFEEMKSKFVAERIKGYNFFMNKAKKEGEKAEKAKDNLEIYLASINRQDKLAELSGEQSRKYLLKGGGENSTLVKMLNDLCEKQQEITLLLGVQEKVAERSISQSLQSQNAVAKTRRESTSKKALEYTDITSETQVGMHFDLSTKTGGFGVNKKERKIALNIYETQNQNEMIESVKIGQKIVEKELGIQAIEEEQNQQTQIQQTPK